jgi:hypothetical protein
MPYSKQELEANEHYTSLSKRDEIKYNQNYQKVEVKFTARGGKYWDTLRNNQNIIQLYEDIVTGDSKPDEHQRLHVELYRRRYRTKIESKDIFDREFKEF